MSVKFKMKKVLDAIYDYDTQYRSNGRSYLRCRKHFLKRAESNFNTRVRDRVYLPLRILLLETTSKRAKFPLSDLWALLEARRLKSPSVHSIPVEDIEPILWQKVCSAMTAPGPISTLHFAAHSSERFAFSTLDGSLHFVSIVDQQLRALGAISLPNISFLRFQWLAADVILGFGVSSSAYVLHGENRIAEINLPALPSEVIKFRMNGAIGIIGSQTGVLMCCDRSGLSSAPRSFQPDSPVTVSRVDWEIVKLHNAKKSISSLAATTDAIFCGTSDGDIDIVQTEIKTGKKRGKSLVEIRLKSVWRVSATRLCHSVKNASVDSISFLEISDRNFVFINLRNEDAALLDFRDKQLLAIEHYRVPSVRAKCPCAMNDWNGKWNWLCGSDMGDLIVCEEDQDPVILTMHEDAIVAVQWLKHRQMFVAADASGLVSFWKKTLGFVRK
jgi:hypothetical protein